MKSNLMLLFLLLTSVVTFSQWEMIDSTKTHLLYDLIATDKYMFAGGGNTKPTYVLKRSTDKGTTWTPVTVGLSSLLSVNQITGSGEEFYLQGGGAAGTGSGLIYRSTDGGLNWTKVSNGISIYETTELLKVNGFLIASVKDGIYKSTDNGTTWIKKNTGLSGTIPYNLLNTSAHFFTYTPNVNGYDFSTTDGENWSKGSVPNSLLKDMYTDGNNVYLLGNDLSQLPYMSTNNGTTWITGKSVGGTAYLCYRIAGTGNNVFISSQMPDKFVYLSKDGMQTWTKVSDGLPVTGVRVDDILIKGEYVYLVYISDDGTTSYQIWRRKLSDFGITTSVNQTTLAPNGYSLSANFPNPFNPTTKFNYELPAMSFVEIKIYDMTGREIETLVNKVEPAGRYTIEWNASKYTSGIYYYTLKSGWFSETKKMIVMK